MPRAMQMIVPAVAALSAGALLAGCGGSSKSTSTSGTTRATTNTTPAPLTKAQATALAQAINLQPADVAGFKAIAQSGHETASEKALGRELEKCAHGAGEAHKLAEVKSDEFKRELKGLPQEVSSSVSIEQSPAYAEQDLKAIKSPLGHRCIVKLVNAAFKGRNLAGAKVGSGSIAEGTPPAAGTNGAFGLRLALPISVQGITVTAYFDFLGFIHGPEEITLQSTGVNEAFPAATQERLFSLLVRRASSHPG
jgi:hypothetical protein